MDRILEKSRCTGCTACMNACPKKAIVFREGDDGFLYPEIIKEKCINCGLCKKTCPILNKTGEGMMDICYVGYNKQSSERLNASSGSIFSLVANYVLDNNGIVVGAAFDKTNHLKHIAINKKRDLGPLKKSKYIQSDLGNIFTYIKEQVQNKKVLFAGTPCQVAGLKALIDKNNNLITVDLFCHGVPSPKLFEKYVEELETDNNDKLINYDFRDNSTGWISYSNRAIFKEKEIVTFANQNNYMKLFLSDIALRESCYDCKFKLGNKYSDITLGDFWGVEKYLPDIYNREGVSAIIINTEVGIKLFNEIKKDIVYKPCDLDKVIVENPSLIKSPSKPKKRVDFFFDLNNMNFSLLAKKYIHKETLLKKIKDRIKTLIINIKYKK